MNSLLSIPRGFIKAVREINEKYKTPHITMTRPVRYSLLMLRLYLFFMVAIMLYKFITLVAH
jgi:hypothetical protein